MALEEDAPAHAVATVAVEDVTDVRAVAPILVIADAAKKTEEESLAHPLPLVVAPTPQLERTDVRRSSLLLVRSLNRSPDHQVRRKNLHRPSQTTKLMKRTVIKRVAEAAHPLQSALLASYLCDFELVCGTAGISNCLC